MPKIQHFNSDDFDKLKIFLITNFNIQFFNDTDPTIQESFQITTSEGTIDGHFFSDDVLELNFNEESKTHFEKIYSFIKKTNSSIIDTTEETSREFFDNFLLNSKMFFEHISDCDICKKKFSKIIKHLN